MARMPRYNKDTHKLEWVDADADAPEYLAWKEKTRAGGRKGAAKTNRKNTSSSETLDDDASETARPEPRGPKRSGGANTRPQSMLAPVLPRIAQSLVIGIQAATNNLTRGQAPMSQAEAVAVAVPAIRIADRTAAKYIRKSGKVTPNQEDAALILLTVVVWAIGWIVSSLQKKPRQQTAPAPQADTGGVDLFAGSEPVSPPQPAPASTAAHGRRVASPPASAGATAEPAHMGDDGDLFAGSEPIAPGGDVTDAPAPMRGRVSPQQAAAAERLWQAITPTDMGETLAG